MPSLLLKAQLVLLQMPLRSVTLLKAVVAKTRQSWRTKIKTATVQTSTTTINDTIVRCNLRFLLLKEKSTHVNWPKLNTKQTEIVCISSCSGFCFCDLQQRVKAVVLRAGPHFHTEWTRQSLNSTQCVYMHVGMQFLWFQ